MCDEFEWEELMRAARQTREQQEKSGGKSKEKGKQSAPQGKPVKDQEPVPA